jgi:acetyl-CoA decarbonylase/synthase complex subunit beta
MPKEVMERVKNFIPAELAGKIATEENAKTVDDLKAFLKERNHPIVGSWKEEAPTVEEAVPTVSGDETQYVPVATASTLPLTAGGFKIILKDAKIYAKKVIIRSTKSEKSEKR